MGTGALEAEISQLLCPIWGLDRTGGMGKELWRVVATEQSPPSVPGFSQRTTMSQGQPFIPLASWKRDSIIQICKSNFVLLLFPVLFPILIPPFLLLSLTMLWQNFLVWCGETCPSLLYSIPLPCSLTSAEIKFCLCQKISVFPTCQTHPGTFGWSLVMWVPLDTCDSSAPSLPWAQPSLLPWEILHTTVKH